MVNEANIQYEWPTLTLSKYRAFIHTETTSQIYMQNSQYPAKILLKILNAPKVYQSSELKNSKILRTRTSLHS